MAEATLQITEDRQGPLAVLKLSGEADAKTSPQLKNRLESLITSGAKRILIDCAQLTYIASAGIGTLNAALKSVKDNGGELILSSLTKEVRDTMELMFFTKRVRVFDSLEEGKGAI